MISENWKKKYPQIFINVVLWISEMTSKFPPIEQIPCLTEYLGGKLFPGCQVILYSYILKILLYFLYLSKNSYISSQNPIFFQN
jgi:hypothetical protein